MYAVAEAYADAACYVRDCGFDIAHVHAGHGWLFAQFISPLVNHRTDNYGGSFENRIRFPLMCLKRMREKVGNQMILSMRISGSEREEGGFTPDDIAEFVSRAEKYIDFIEVSTEGWQYCMPSAYMDRCLNAPFADAIRNSGKVHIPVFVVGCVVDPDDAEELPDLSGHFASLVAQAEALSRRLPDFDAEAAFADPAFLRLTAPGMGVGVEAAWYALHGPELRRSAALRDREALARAV